MSKKKAQSISIQVRGTAKSIFSGKDGGAMTAFTRSVAAHAVMAEELPLIHTSLCEYLPAIATTHTLEPRPCNIFKESLVYLFYGRPAYRSSRGIKNGEAIALCPVCFVFKPRTVSCSLRRIFPCDSGAVAGNLFAPDITSADLEDLEIDSQVENARRAVGLFFEQNSNYFAGRVTAGRAFPAGSVEARFYALLQRPGPVGYDDRKSAIEAQVNHSIALRNQLLFVVLPREFLEIDAIRHAIIYEWNCDPIPYPTFQGDAPAAYYSVVRQKVTERFTEATRI